jgi:hypothetical protein
MRDLVNQITVIKNIVVGAKSANAAVNGAAANLANRDYALVVIHVEAWTDGTHTPKMQECATSGGTYTDVAAGDQIGSFTAITDNTGVGTKQKVGYIGKLGFIRAVLTTSGATTGMVAGADVITGSARKQPQ